jgi:pyrroloquinoline quinone biosynthesis protein E
MDHLDADALPVGLVAELTHRCLLGCPYCSNPLALEPREDELDASTWARVFQEAAALGIRQVHLSGGEPGARRDLVDIAAHAREAGLHTNLVTSGVGITTRTLRDLWEAGLEQVTVSFQHSGAVRADRIAGRRGAFQRKHALATEAMRLGLPLTVNVVLHRANIADIRDMVELALRLKAGRIELTHVLHEGWALRNQAALAPTEEQLSRANAEIGALRRELRDRIAIDATLLDQRWLVVTPSGRVPALASTEGTAGEEWNVRDHSLADIWAKARAFSGVAAKAFRPHQVPPGDFSAAQEAAPFIYRCM